LLRLPRMNMTAITGRRSHGVRWCSAAPRHSPRQDRDVTRSPLRENPRSLAEDSRRLNQGSLGNYQGRGFEAREGTGAGCAHTGGGRIAVGTEDLIAAGVGGAIARLSRGRVQRTAVMAPPSRFRVRRRRGTKRLAAIQPGGGAEPTPSMCEVRGGGDDKKIIERYYQAYTQSSRMRKEAWKTAIRRRPFWPN